MVNELDNATLMARAPSVFATRPWVGQSEKYRFIPTIQVVDALRDHGFYPVRAQQSASRIPGKGDFTKHMLRFRLRGNDLPVVGDVIPEVGLTNSHDGTSAYNLFLGLFRLICRNGAVVAMGQLSQLKARHSGRLDLVQEVISESLDIFKNAPRVLNRVQEWQKIQLDQPEQLALASSALTVLDSNVAIQPESLLQARRYQDRGNGTRDLWTTFNVLQENTLRGGVFGRTATGRRFHTREVKSVDRDIKLNKALWLLADKMAELKTGIQPVANIVDAQVIEN